MTPPAPHPTRLLWLALPGVGVLAAFFVAPLASVLIEAGKGDAVLRMLAAPEFRDALAASLWLGARAAALSLVVGVFISVLQAATQIQEMTLTFVPKILSMFIALLIAFPWMMDKMINFTRDLFMNIPTYIR